MNAIADLFAEKKRLEIMISQNWDSTTDLEDFYIKNAVTFFANTPLDNEVTRRYEYSLLKEKEAVNDVVIVKGDKILGMGICYKVNYLSNYFGKSIGVLDGLVISKEIERDRIIMIAEYIIDSLGPSMDEKFDFISVNVPSTYIELIQSMEECGFCYAEGFNNMCGWVGVPRYYLLTEEVILGDTIIREAVKSDFSKIEKSYLSSDFPSHLVTDPFFDEEEAKRLYVQNFHYTWKNKLGKVWVAEIDGDFAGALIGKIDEDLKRKTDVVTNARSGMGIIVDAKYRNQSVAQQLLIERDGWYQDQGVKWQILGANISNVPMIRLLEKKGFSHASTTITMHKKF